MKFNDLANITKNASEKSCNVTLDEILGSHRKSELKTVASERLIKKISKLNKNELKEVIAEDISRFLNRTLDTFNHFDMQAIYKIIKDEIVEDELKDSLYKLEKNHIVFTRIGKNTLNYYIPKDLLKKIAPYIKDNKEKIETNTKIFTLLSLCSPFYGVIKIDELVEIAKKELLKEFTNEQITMLILEHEKFNSSICIINGFVVDLGLYYADNYEQLYNARTKDIPYKTITEEDYLYFLDNYRCNNPFYDFLIKKLYEM